MVEWQLAAPQFHGQQQMVCCIRCYLPIWLMVSEKGIIRRPHKARFESMQKTAQGSSSSDDDIKWFNIRRKGSSFRQLPY